MVINPWKIFPIWLFVILADYIHSFSFFSFFEYSIAAPILFCEGLKRSCEGILAQLLQFFIGSQINHSPLIVVSTILQIFPVCNLFHPLHHPLYPKNWLGSSLSQISLLGPHSPYFGPSAAKTLVLRRRKFHFRLEFYLLIIV